MDGVSCMCSRLVYVTARSSSILEGKGSLVAHKISWARSLPWSILPGFHFCVVGLILIAIYASRLAFGIAALPLSLPDDGVSRAQDSGTSKRVQFLIWVLMGPLYLVSILLLWFT